MLIMKSGQREIAERIEPKKNNKSIRMLGEKENYK